MDSREKDAGILTLCAYEREVFSFLLRANSTMLDLQMNLSARFPDVVPSSVMFRYKIFGHTVRLYEDSDVASMFRLHDELKLKMVEMVVEVSGSTKLINMSMETSIESDDYAYLNVDSIAPCVNSIDGSIRCIRGVNRTFSDARDFRRCIVKYAVAIRKDFCFIKNFSEKVTVECVVEGCPWRIYGAYQKRDGQFAIRKCNLHHTCSSVNEITGRHPKANYRWVAELIQPKLRAQPSYSHVCFMDDILRDYGVDITYKKAWCGKEQAIKKIHGADRGSYEKLRWFCDSIKRTNPGSIAYCETDPDTNKFKRIFIAFHASITGFVRGCRPLLFLDGTHIKNKHKGCLMSVVSKDGNNGLFTVAFAVVNAENNENLQWFCMKLKSMLCLHGRGDFSQYTFFTDRNEGLLNAVPYVFQGSNHSYCLRQLVDNFKKQVLSKHPRRDKKQWALVFKKVAYAITIPQFQKHISLITETFPEASKFINEFDPYCWANSLFPGKRWGIINNNMAESFNSWVRVARVLPIVGLIDEIRQKIMAMMTERRDESYRHITRLCTKPEKILTDNIEQSRFLEISKSCGYVFEVYEQEKLLAVDLAARTCSCKYCQLLGIPCRHAVRCIHRLDLSPYDFTDTYYTVEKFKDCYADAVNPIPTLNADDEEMIEDVLEPNTLRQPGRPRTKRLQSQFELRLKRKCGRCNKYGHNRHTCKEAI